MVKVGKTINIPGSGSSITLRVFLSLWVLLLAACSGAPEPVSDLTAPCGDLPSVREQFDCVSERELEPGAIAYSAPEQAQVGKSERVTVRLTREDLPQVGKELEEGLGSTGAPPTVASLEVVPKMRAQLKGPEFQVEALTPEDQSLQRTGFGEWIWEITPTRSGTHSLVLTVTALLGDESLNDVTLKREIEVDVNIASSLREWWFANWKWALASGSPALVAIGWLAKHARPWFRRIYNNWKEQRQRLNRRDPATTADRASGVHT